MSRRLPSVLGCLLLLAGNPLAGSELREPEELAREVEELRLRSVSLARDIWLLEQQSGDELGQLLVFLSVDPRLGDRPARVELTLGDERIVEHVYRADEQSALAKGGAHRLFAAPVDAGRHVLDAQLQTEGDLGPMRRNVKLSFRVGAALKTIELRLERVGRGDAELTVREWD